MQFISALFAQADAYDQAQTTQLYVKVGTIMAFVAVLAAFSWFMTREKKPRWLSGYGARRERYP